MRIQSAYAADGGGEVTRSIDRVLHAEIDDAQQLPANVNVRHNKRDAVRRPQNVVGDNGGVFGIPLRSIVQKANHAAEDEIGYKRRDEQDNPGRIDDARRRHHRMDGATLRIKVRARQCLSAARHHGEQGVRRACAR